MSNAIVLLGLPPSELDRISPSQVSHALGVKRKEEEDQYELLAHTISVGYARTQTKKKIELFKKASSETAPKERVGKIDPLKKKGELSSLFKEFGT